MSQHYDLGALNAAEMRAAMARVEVTRGEVALELATMEVRDRGRRVPRPWIWNCILVGVLAGFLDFTQASYERVLGAIERAASQKRRKVGAAAGKS